MVLLFTVCWSFLYNRLKDKDSKDLLPTLRPLPTHESKEVLKDKQKIKEIERDYRKYNRDYLKAKTRDNRDYGEKDDRNNLKNND